MKRMDLKSLAKDKCSVVFFVVVSDNCESKFNPSKDEMISASFREDCKDHNRSIQFNQRTTLY